MSTMLVLTMLVWSVHQSKTTTMTTMMAMTP